MLTSAISISVLPMVLFPWIQAEDFTAVYPQNNRRLDGHLLKNASTENQYECKADCDDIPDCHSINFHPAKIICELNNANHLSKPDDLKESNGFTYLNYFLHPVSECNKSLCSNSSFNCLVEKDGINFRCDLPGDYIAVIESKVVGESVKLNGPNSRPAVSMNVEYLWNIVTFIDRKYANHQNCPNKPPFPALPCPPFASPPLIYK